MVISLQLFSTIQASSLKSPCSHIYYYTHFEGLNINQARKKKALAITMAHRKREVRI